LHFKRGAIGLRGAASKLLNVKSGHDFEFLRHVTFTGGVWADRPSGTA
jgi:hypothetical protein